MKKTDKKELVYNIPNIPTRAKFRELLEKYKTVLSKKIADPSDPAILKILDIIPKDKNLNDLELTQMLLQTSEGREYLKSRVMTSKEEEHYETATIELFKSVVNWESSTYELNELLESLSVEELWSHINSFRSRIKL